MDQFRIAFPLLNQANHKVTSPETDEYNCIAWAAEEDDRWWWPDPYCSLAYWPATVARVPSVDAFVKAFGTLGYEVCQDGTLEIGYQKVVLYVDPLNIPTHMARQLPDGHWTSKLGEWHDIRHSRPEDIGGGVYGQVALYMRREQVVT